MAKAGQYVVWSNSRCRVPYDHSKYGICRVSLPWGAPMGTVAHVDTEYSRAGVEAASALLRHPFHLDALGGQIVGHRLGGVAGVDVRHLHSPYGGLEPVCQARYPSLDDLEHVDPIGHGRVDRVPDLIGPALLGHGEL